MQADAQAGIFPRQRHGLAGARLIDHQAGAGQDALAMGADDGLVDGLRAAKIIRIDDQPPPGLRAVLS